MEVIRPSKFATKDFLTSMPNIVITNILDRLALQDAVRTSILSKNWRFKWTMLSQLVFDKKFFECLLKTEGRHNYGRQNYGRIISRLLLHLKGAITKFALYIDSYSTSKLVDEDINHWMLFLSTKGIKDLTFWKINGEPLKLPTHLFSCLELEHLNLFYCCFYPPTSFHGFPNLLSLELGMVKFYSSKFGKYITGCPLLEVLKSWSTMQSNDSFPPVNVKLVEIAKLENLKILSFSLSYLDNMIIKSSNTIFELLGFLPRLQELDLNFEKCKLIEDAVKKRPPASFPCLKGLKLTRIDLADGIKLSCAFELIRCSPNPQTLEISACVNYYPPVPPPPVPPAILEEVDYNTMKLLQLRIVVFTSLNGSDNEVCLIKYLLACSPLLKKIVIRLNTRPASNEQSFARKLLELHRASPVAEIKLN